MKQIKEFESWAEKSELTEGGNVFKAQNWTPDKPSMLTRRIRLREIPKTVRHIEKVTGIPGLMNNLLGSTGVAQTSGDIDIAIDSKVYDKNDLLNNMIQRGVKSYDLRKTGNTLHYKSPIPETKDFVQVDLMFVPDVVFAKWSMHPMPNNSRYKGVHWQKLMADITRTVNPNWKWNSLEGVLTRDTNQKVFGYDPRRIVHGLFGSGVSLDDVKSVESIIRVLDAHKNKAEILDKFEQTLQGDARVPQIKQDVVDRAITEAYGVWFNDIK